MSLRDDLLLVALPGGRNTQQTSVSTATGSATHGATTNLKALADKCLERKKRNTHRNTCATEGQDTAQQMGDLEGANVALVAEGNAYSQEASDWLPWITDRCPLVAQDKGHIMRGLYHVHPRLKQRLAVRYVEAWKEAADAEPLAHRKDNAGRLAANLIITRLNTGGDEHEADT